MCAKLLGCYWGKVILFKKLLCLHLKPFIVFSSSSATIEQQSKIDFKALLLHFKSIQSSHQQHRINQRKRTVALWDRGLPKE